MDARTKLQTIEEDIADLNIPSPHAQYDQQSPPPHDTEWLAPSGHPHMLHKNRRVNVSIDTKTLPVQEDAERYDEEGVATPRYISTWVLA